MSERYNRERAELRAAGEVWGHNKAVLFLEE